MNNLINNLFLNANCLFLVLLNQKPLPKPMPVELTPKGI